MKNIFNNSKVNLTKFILWLSIVACLGHIIRYCILGTMAVASFSTWLTLAIVWFSINVSEKSDKKVNNSVGNTEN